jgi:SOS-response transcriptional repressor LexA
VNTVTALHKTIQDSIVRLAKERDAAKSAAEAKQAEVETKEAELSVLLKALNELEVPFKKGKKTKAKVKKAKRSHKAKAKANGATPHREPAEREQKVFAAIQKAGPEGIGKQGLVDRTGYNKDEISNSIYMLKFHYKRIRSIDKGIYGALES